MTDRPQGTYGPGSKLLCAVVVIALLATIVVAILAYMQAPPAPARGSATMPAQAAQQSETPAQ